MTSYSHRSEADGFNPNETGRIRHPFTSSLVRYNRNFLAVGSGFFTTSQGTDVFSFYGGVGFGSAAITDRGVNDLVPYAREHTTNLVKYFFQPGFSHVSEKSLRLDLSVRLSLINYENIKTNYTPAEQEKLRLQGLQSSALLSFFEPSITLSFPFPKIQGLFIEAGLSGNSGSPYRDVRKSVVFVGLTTDPVKAFRRK
jgi:hypothetical protein